MEDEGLPVFVRIEILVWYLYAMAGSQAPLSMAGSDAESSPVPESPVFVSPKPKASVRVRSLKRAISVQKKKAHHGLNTCL